MMIKHVFTTTVTAALIISLMLACKKKDNNATTTNTGSTTSATTGGTTGGTTTGGNNYPTNTANWTMNGSTYTINTTFGAVSWASNGSSFNEQTISAIDNAILSPFHEIAFTFHTSTPATGTYTLRDFYNNSNALGANEAYSYASSGGTYLHLNGVGTNTISVSNVNNIVTVNFNGIIYTAASSSVTPSTYTISGHLTK